MIQGPLVILPEQDEDKEIEGEDDEDEDDEDDDEEEDGEDDDEDVESNALCFLSDLFNKIVMEPFPFQEPSPFQESLKSRQNSSLNLGLKALEVGIPSRCFSSNVGYKILAFNTLKFIFSAGYTTTEVACGWAGAVVKKLTKHLGRSGKAKNAK